MSPVSARPGTVAEFQPARSQHLIGYERIGAPLLAKGRHGSMARHELNPRAQRPQPAGDRIDELLIVPTREIRAADGALEEHITHLGKADAAMEEHHMAGRMTGAMEHLELRLAEGDLVAVEQPTVGGEGPGVRHAVTLAGVFDLVDPELVVGMGPLDGNAGGFLQGRDAAG